MIIALFILVMLGIIAFGTKIAIEGGGEPLDVCAVIACSTILGYLINQVL